MSTEATRPALRRDGWERRLAVYLAAAEAREFGWGSFDCCLFAAGCVNAVTGVDPAAGHRGKYRSAAQATRLMQRAGGLAKLVDQLCTRVGMAPCAPSFARRGDVVLLEAQDASPAAVGICMGAVALAPQEPRGLTAVTMARAVRAWHINHSKQCLQSSQQ